MKTKGRTARALRAAALLALLLCLPAPAARAAPDDDCAAGRHRYTEIRRTPATAMEDGEADFRCDNCGHEYTDILFATNHLWGEWVTGRQPTCTEPGERHRTCTRAQPHDEYAAIPALGHAYRESIAKEPACLEPGRKVFTCANDPAHTYEAPIPAHGSHSFGEWRVETPAHEGAEGREARECGRCDFRETRPLAALPMETTAAGPTATTAEPPAQATQATEPPVTESRPPARSPSVADILLVSANVVSLGGFAFLLVPYFLFLAYAKKRRRAIEQRDALRKEVDALRGFK